MRELRFRAWHKSNKAFVYATLSDFVKNGWRQCEAGKPLNDIPLDPKQPCFVMEDALLSWIDSSFFGSKNTSWQQFTGLEDKNGKEIYEGDILKHPVLGYTKPIIAEVKFAEGCFGIFTRFIKKFVMGGRLPEFSLLGNGFRTEVIGNIYENPELLREK